MKKSIALLFLIAFVFCGCAPVQNINQPAEKGTYTKKDLSILLENDKSISIGNSQKDVENLLGKSTGKDPVEGLQYDGAVIVYDDQKVSEITISKTNEKSKIISNFRGAKIGMKIDELKEIYGEPTNSSYTGVIYSFECLEDSDEIKLLTKLDLMSNKADTENIYELSFSKNAKDEIDLIYIYKKPAF